MPLALNLVSQPDTGYLTTGATDFVNAVDSGQKSLLAKQAAQTQNERSALDLRMLKEKAARDTAISGRLPDLIGAADKAQLTAQNKADLLQYNPELANKIIATNDAKVKENISNFLGSSLLKLAHSTDAESDKTAILDAVNHYGIPLNLSDNPSPEELRNALMLAARGVDALKDTTMTTSPTGERITTTRAGEVTDIKPAEKVKQPVVPMLDANGKEITKTTSLGYGKTLKERKMSDGTWEKLGESTPPAQTSPKGPKLYETLDDKGHLRFELVPEGQLPKGKPKGEGVGKIEAGRVEMINNAANDAITALSQIQSLPIASQVLPVFNSADAKKGIFNENLKKLLSNQITEETAQIYRAIASGLALDAAKVKSGGMFVNQKVIDEISKGIIVQAGETEGVALFKLAESARRLYSSLSTMTRGTPEQIEVRNKLADYLKENFPDPNLILAARTGTKYTPTPDVLHSIRQSENEGNGTKPAPSKSATANQPKTPYDWYVLRWNQAKNDPALQKKLTDAARAKGIVK